MLIAAWSVSLSKNPVPPRATPSVLPTMSTTAAPAVRAEPRAIGLGPVSVFNWSKKMTGLIAAANANGTTCASRLLIGSPDTRRAHDKRDGVSGETLRHFSPDDGPRRVYAGRRGG